MDPGNKKVSRLYLEYCENGDMLGLIRKAYEYVRTAPPPPLFFVWWSDELMSRCRKYSEKKPNARGDYMVDIRMFGEWTVCSRLWH